jgi:hypothetical protein
MRPANRSGSMGNKPKYANRKPQQAQDKAPSTIEQKQ